jgi:hypothetical protein
LILALVFIVVVAVIVGAVSSLALNNLNNTTKFNSAAALDYSASSVANLAIEGVRYAPQSTDATPGPCWNASTSAISQATFNSQTVAIWCTSVHHSGSTQSRDVTMIACVSTPAAAGDSTAQSNAAEANCATNPLLTLVEAYDDYSASGTDACVGAQASASTCGFGASTLVWKWGSLASAVGGLILNSITVTSPVPVSATVGGTYTPVASATSGDPVTINAVTSACTVSGGVVSFATTGACTLNFTDPGNFNYAPAGVVTQTFQIS